MTARHAALAFVLFACAIAAPVEAQGEGGRPCELILNRVVRGVDTTRVRSVTSGTGGRNLYIGAGVDATCEGQGNRLLADSAEHFADQGLLILYHNVRYTESRVRITSDKMFYYTTDEHLVAEGNVRGVTPSGTRFAGPQMEYYREKVGVRELPYWIATGRPFMRMSPTESGGASGTSGDSLDLTANRIYSLNDSLVWASGQVIIERSDMRATGDSATLDNGIEFARLLRDPRIVGKGERAFTLVGTEIDMYSKERELQRVLASGNAKATSDSLVLTSDTIDLRIVDQQMNRVYTWGGRSRAVSAQQDIESDSMDILMPGQKLERVNAIGRAMAYSAVDSSKVISAERDWIAGDTINAAFETVPATRDSTTTDTTRTTSDTTSTTRMRDVTASGSARAFYQLPASGGVRGLPNLSYNRGRVITVHFEDGEMSTVTVSEKASGIYLEPSAPAPTTTAPGASTPPRTPTTAAPSATPVAPAGRERKP